MNYFSSLFREELYIFRRVTVHHQESYCSIHSNGYLSYYLCCLSASSILTSLAVGVHSVAWLWQQFYWKAVKYKGFEFLVLRNILFFRAIDICNLFGDFQRFGGTCWSRLSGYLPERPVSWRFWPVSR